MSGHPTPESLHLRCVAERVTEAYADHPQLRAAMVTGSAAEGCSDRFSDVDMTMYYETLPDDMALSASRIRLGGADRRWSVDERPAAFVEAFLLDGIEIQIGHVTIAEWERDIDRVLAAEEVASPLHKAMSGTLNCIALRGEALVDGWKARIRDFPEPLAEAMVRHYLTFFSLWGIVDLLARRDALVWRQEICVQTAQNTLGVLAGINRVYFTTFQLKRMTELIDALPVRPDDLAARIERLFDPDLAVVGATMERLVSELVDLVGVHMPNVDTTPAASRLGWRHQPWQA